MSDEFDHHPENNFSPFWPLLILVIGLLIWFGIQDYGLNNQQSAYAKQFKDKQVVATVNESQSIGAKYVALMKDLVQISTKDPIAAQIVQDAIKAGWIHVQPNANGTNSAATPAAPTPTK